MEGAVVPGVGLLLYAGIVAFATAAGLRGIRGRADEAERARLAAAFDLLWVIAVVCVVAVACALVAVTLGEQRRSASEDGHAQLLRALRAASPAELLARNCTRAPLRLPGRTDAAGFGDWLSAAPCRSARELAGHIAQVQEADRAIAAQCSPEQRRHFERQLFQGTTRTALPACALADRCARAWCTLEQTTHGVLARALTAPMDLREDTGLQEVRNVLLHENETTPPVQGGGTPLRPAALLLTLLALAAALGLRLAMAVHRLCARSAGQPRAGRLSRTFLALMCRLRLWAPAATSDAASPTARSR